MTMQSQSTPPLPHQRELSAKDSVRHYKQLLDRLVPVLATPAELPAHISAHLLQVREQILTGLLRVGVVLGTVALLVALLPPLLDTPPPVLAIDAGILVAIWAAALRRRLDYRLRAGVLVTGLYIISCIELTYYGFSQDASILFLFCALLAVLFFNQRVGGAVLALSVTTLASVGALISTGRFTPLAHPLAELSLSTMITTCLLFVMIAGSVQAGVALLLDRLDLAWQHEYHARQWLQDERDLLDQRVADRTRELALARDQALEASRAEAAQNAYLAALHQTTLELLHHRDISDVFQTLVDRLAMVLDAPYGELMLIEDDELVVCAFTANQPFLRGDRVRRGEAALTWQAFDHRQPAILEDYSGWAARREVYSDAHLAAVADFPILVGADCIGVLAIGRDTPGYVFTADDIQKGTLFAQLAALVVENAQLYDTAKHEIHERLQAEQALQAQNAELDAFAHTVAHDLKSPLTGLLGHSQLLLEIQELMTPQEVEDSLRAIMRTSQKMATIIDALLLLAHVRAREAIPHAAFTMQSVIEEVVARLQHAITAADATISYPAHWPVALGYAPWIEEVWANYLSNALKYGGDPPIITLGADPAEPGFVRFWVRDNGPGLSSAQQAQLFTPFTRLHTEHTDGQGLGLSIVQRIIAKLGGSVGVESLPGQGATFYFTLPAASRDPSA
jgi:signal transduction histidine kinase